VPYAGAEHGEVSALVAPTPERVATARDWLVEHRIADGSAISVEGACIEIAFAQGVTIPQGGDDDRVDLQRELIERLQWVNAGRQAIYDLHRAGLIVPTSTGYNEGQPTPLLDATTPGVPLGAAGDRVQPTRFPTIPLFKEYVPAMLEEAERQHRLELYNADLFLKRSNLDDFGERVQRCVTEALACYRDALFLAAANMMGAASEAAWHEIAEAMRDAGVAGNSLTTELGKANPVIAAVQSDVRNDLRRLGRAEEFPTRFGITWGAVDTAAEVGRYWRELRNLGMHPGTELDAAPFTESGIATMFMGARSYFQNLAAILTGVRPAVR
jgi:hypothetical protein